MCKTKKTKSRKQYILRYNSKQSGGIHVVNPGEEKGRAAVGGFAEKKGFKSGMKE